MIDRSRFFWPIYYEFFMMMVNQFKNDIEKQVDKICQITFESILLTIGKYFG